MEPAFQRGDILFLNNQDSPIRVGEIVVFKIKDRDIPIVHRVMKVHEKEDGKVRNSEVLFLEYWNFLTPFRYLLAGMAMIL
jgi:signal peptidase I